MQHDHATPEWQDLAHDRQKQRQRDEVGQRSSSQKIDDEYYAARAEALTRFVNGEGAVLYAKLFQKYKQFHVELGSKQPDQEACESDRAKIEEQHMPFVTLADWRDRAAS